MPKELKEQTYYTKGMHCSSCELLIENKLRQLENVKSIKASAVDNKVAITYTGKIPNAGALTGIFEKEGYRFYDQPITAAEAQNKKELLTSLAAVLLVIAGFAIINKSGINGLINVGAESSLPMYFLLGLVAGFSSCAALVGGLVLSMANRWNKDYSPTDSVWVKSRPHILFNVGRIVSYGFFGALLGAVGGSLGVALKVGPWFVIAVSIVMLVLALQMLEVKYAKKIRLSMPKFLVNRITEKSALNGRYMPFLVGASTFFLPCGFTITAQGLALLSNSPLQGALIMVFFALGTLPMLLTIGLSSVKLIQNPKLAGAFIKVAGVMVGFFALYTINAQLTVLGLTNLNDLIAHDRRIDSGQGVDATTKTDDLPTIVNGKQVIKMTATAFDYSPNYFKVKAGVPVRWEITDKGTSGCTNAVVSKELFSGQISLEIGQTSIKEFTPTKPGRYKFSCWMGMVSGAIEVVK